MRDVAIVGGGHNGLACAGYLARAGLDVEVLEANEIPGGCVWTEQIDTGHRLEIGAVDLSMIDEVAADLRLSDHGLDLLGRDVLVEACFGDGARLSFHRDLDTTIAGLTDLAAVDREGYREFARLSQRALAVFDAVPGVPTFGEVIRLAESLSGGIDFTRLIVSSAESEVARHVSDSHLGSAVCMYAAHGQLPPWLPGTGLFSMLLPGSHGGTIYRPRGGTVAFIDALVRAVEAAGGSLRTNARVSGIERRGGVSALRIHDGDVVTSRLVVSSLDVRRTVGLVRDPPEALRRSAAAVRSGALNVGELKVDLALSEPVTIDDGDADAALWLLQERPDSLRRAFAEIVAGALPTSPALMWTSPSALDPSAAPPGGGTGWLSTFVPARLEGRSWDPQTEEEAGERALESFTNITGIDLRRKTVGRRITGPVGWQERVGAPLGNPNHIDLTIDQLFGWRPPGSVGYRTELPWLYLTGAGTFPGGGVSGLPGRNTARSLLNDLRGRRGLRRQRGEIGRLLDAWSLYRTLRRRP